MAELWYMDKEKEGIFYSGWDAERVYDGYRNAHLNTKSSKYGAVLTTTRRIFIGWELKFRLIFRGKWFWQWKPEFRWKYEKRFHWLCFSLRIEREYSTIMDKVIKDHLNDK